MQPSSEACEVEDRCFRVSVARRLMLLHLAVADPADVVQFCATKVRQVSFATNLWIRNSITVTTVVMEKVLIAGMPLWGGCLANVIHSHSGAKVFIEQEVPALTRVVNGQTEHARMDLVQSRIWMSLLLLLSLAVRPWFSAASTKPGIMAKRAEKNKFDRYPHINLVRFILETTGRPGPHARKLISHSMRDADNPPLAIRDTWSAIQSVLHSAISKQQLTAAVT